MCIRYFGFLLLIWFPGVLHAQSSVCSAPKLDDGYFVPEGDAYAHETKLTYACNEGYKPVVEGWWAESTCQNGKWSHEPQCIDENACFLPDIPNGKYKQEERGWYVDGSVIEITCNKGYEFRKLGTTATCRNGHWVYMAVCKIIINQGYQDVFAADSEVQYECEDGFTAERDTKTILCTNGNWTAAPTCIENCRTPPNVPNGDIVERSTMFLKYQCNGYYTLVGSDTVMCYNDGTWSKPPICKEAFCSIISTQFHGTNIKPSAEDTIMREGERKLIACNSYYYYSLFECTNGKISATESQSVEQRCHAPKLDNGYFVPEQETYAHETKLAYACDNGYKPAVDGWWAESTCQDGKWSHEPQCIDEKACTSPTIPNAKYTETSNGWYEEGHKIETTCAKGYQHISWYTTAQCKNGTWSSLPVCDKSVQACGEPPKVSHAIIINQGYQDVFAADSEVQYECEDGFTAERDTKTILCTDGNWTAAPTCIDRCGRIPAVLNGIVETHEQFLKYQCQFYYKQLGPQTVVCYSDGTWSKLPTCKATFCTVDTAKYALLKSVGVKYLADGETMKFECVQRKEWVLNHYSVSHCTDGRIRFTHWFLLSLYHKEEDTAAFGFVHNRPKTSLETFDRQPSYDHAVTLCAGLLGL
ncbi:hypothetical protein PAMP_004588 [Pampus punctatissimus]